MPTSCFIDWFPKQARAAVLPRWNYLHIFDDVLSARRGRGVSDEQIRTMLVDNPRGVFERQGAY